MQRGGFDVIPIKDSDFKYTQDPDRILWTKNVFPIAEYIIQAIQKIPWESYKFVGTSAFWKKSGRFERDDFEVTIHPSSTPRYYYFGGSVYEIMNKLYNRADMPNLHSYVDPTGDLDIMLIPPHLTLAAGKSPEKYYAYFFNQLLHEHPGKKEPANLQRHFNTTNGRMNLANIDALNTSSNALSAEPTEFVGCANNIFTGNNTTRETVIRDPRQYSKWIEHYTDWIMDNFADNLKKYQKGGLFTLLFGNSVKFNLENDAEGRYADRVLCIGNLKLVRSYLPYMNLIKIQLIAKFQDMTRSDHICEFLMEMPHEPSVSIEKFDSYKHKYQVLKGFPLTTFSELVRGNLDSMINRYSLFQTTLRHKFYNHVGRMQYLNDFFNRNLNPYYEKNASKLILSGEEYTDLGNQMAKFSFYIAENYFTTQLFDFDSQGKSQGIPAFELSRLRNQLLKGLIGSYPKFLLRKGVSGKYKSPFVSIAFSEGDQIPARTKFPLHDIFDAAQTLPPPVIYELKLYKDKINTLQLFFILKQLSILSF